MRQFKVLVLGDLGSGKSALEASFIKDGFLESEKVLEVDPLAEDDSYHRSFVVDGRTDSLEFLDASAAGQFSSLMDIYIRSAQGFILVFNLTRKESLAEVDRQREHIYRVKGREKNIPIVVVGNKLDLMNQREISRSTLSALSESWNLPFYEVSAKRNWHVKDVFDDLVRKMRKWEGGSHRHRRRHQKKRCVSASTLREEMDGRPLGCIVM